MADESWDLTEEWSLTCPHCGALLGGTLMYVNLILDEHQRFCPRTLDEEAPPGA